MNKRKHVSSYFSSYAVLCTVSFFTEFPLFLQNVYGQKHRFDCTLILDNKQHRILLRNIFEFLYFDVCVCVLLRTSEVE
jgi:hypothetical protein